MKQFRFFLYVIALAALSCQTSQKPSESIYGTWQSLWEEDMILQLQLDESNRFKVTLSRTGMMHTNSGWYTADNNLFMLKDSANYPLPVCNFSDTGKYHFELNHDTLQFKLLSDACDRRSGALVLEKFVKVK